MKVYTYDKQTAKACGMYYGMGKRILIGLAVGILLVGAFVAGAYVDQMMNTEWYFTAVAIVLWIIVFVVIVARGSVRTRAQLTSIVIDDNCYIYVLVNKNDGRDLAIASQAGGYVVGKVMGKEKLGSAIGTVGTIVALHQHECACKNMENKYIVERLFYEADSDRRYTKHRIDSIISVTDTGKYYLVHANVTNMRTNKAKKNAKLKIYKLYMDNGRLFSIAKP